MANFAGAALVGQRMINQGLAQLRQLEPNADANVVANTAAEAQIKMANGATVLHGVGKAAETQAGVAQKAL